MLPQYDGTTDHPDADRTAATGRAGGGEQLRQHSPRVGANASAATTPVPSPAPVRQSPPGPVAPVRFGYEDEDAGMEVPLVADGSSALHPAPPRVPQGAVRAIARPATTLRPPRSTPACRRFFYVLGGVAFVMLAATVVMLGILVSRGAHGAAGPQAVRPALPGIPTPCDDGSTWPQAQGNVLVVYYEPAPPGSAANYTAQMASAVAAGAANQTGLQRVRVMTTAQVSFKEDILEWADAVVIGSPVFNANVHPVVQGWIDSWDFRADLSNKVGAAFVTAGGMSAGEELTTVSLLHSMMIFRMIIVGGTKWTMAFGASGIMAEQPWGPRDPYDPQYFAGDCYPAAGRDELNALFLNKGVQLGRRVATVARQLRLHPDSAPGR